MMTHAEIYQFIELAYTLLAFGGLLMMILTLYIIFKMRK